MRSPSATRRDRLMPADFAYLSICARSCGSIEIGTIRDFNRGSLRGRPDARFAGVLFAAFQARRMAAPRGRTSSNRCASPSNSSNDSSFRCGRFILLSVVFGTGVSLPGLTPWREPRRRPDPRQSDRPIRRSSATRIRSRRPFKTNITWSNLPIRVSPQTKSLSSPFCSGQGAAAPSITNSASSGVT